MTERDNSRAPSDAVPRDRLVVAERHLVADDILALVLRRPDGGRLPDWTPGAHIDLVLPDGTTRQYSLHGDPAIATEYRVAVLREPGGHGSILVHDQLPAGAHVGFGGPRNNFRLVPSESFAFVAGGIGITPILPMLRAATTLGAHWRLIYLGRSRDRMAFLDELRPFGSRVTVHSTDDGGHADLEAWVGPFDAPTKVYACGPERMTDALLASSANWRPGWLRIERFAAADRGLPVRTTPFEVEIAGSDRIVRIAPGVPVATALRDAGFDLLTSCSRGVCGTCETRVLAGVPDHRDAILDDAERADGACFFPCVSGARSDRLVLAL